MLFSECCGGGAVRGCGGAVSVVVMQWEGVLPWAAMSCHVAGGLACGWLMSGYSIVDRPHVWEGRRTGGQEDKVGTCWHLIISTCPGWPQALYRLHCTYYPALHCTVLHCSALYFSTLWCTTQQWTRHHHTALYYTALHTNSPLYIEPHPFALYYTILHCIMILYYTRLHCTT